MQMTLPLSCPGELQVNMMEYPSLQVNTMEYPGTIGAPYIQYMTTDFLTAPPHIMREGYTEKALPPA